jgi:hypothetical protein
MRTSILVAAALAASVGTAWGQAPADLGCSSLQLGWLVGKACGYGVDQTWAADLVQPNPSDHPSTFTFTTRGSSVPNDAAIGSPAPAIPLPDTKCPFTGSCPGRAYTLDEIDRMRMAINDSVWGGVEMCEKVPSCAAKRLSYPTEHERNIETESRLRTYMAAGISPEALEAKAKEGK